MCLATLRKDGFVSLTAGDEAGQLITKPFIASGNQLLVSVDVHQSGACHVEVLDEDKKSIRGCELGASFPLRGRSIEKAVGWTAEADWSQLVGRKVRLRIRLRNADLYAFWVGRIKEQRDAAPAR